MREIKAILVAGLFVAGCGRTGVQPILPNMMAVSPPPAVSTEPEQLHSKLLAKLGLSSDQIAQIKAIKKQHMATIKPAIKAQHLAIKNALLADTVDVPALKQLMLAHYQTILSDIPAIVDMMSDMRAVLTADQQKKLSELLLEKSTQAKMVSHHMKKLDQIVADLNLTAAQQTAFDALKAKILALHSPDRVTIKMKALSDFALNGDKAALLSSIEQLKVAPPVDEATNFLAALDLKQRTELIAKIHQLKEKMKKHWETKENTRI